MEINIDQTELTSFITEIYQLLHQYYDDRRAFIVKYMDGMVTVGNFSKQGSYTPYYYNPSTPHDYDVSLREIIERYNNLLYSLTRYTSTGNYMIHYNHSKQLISICRLANQISGRQILTIRT